MTTAPHPPDPEPAVEPTVEPAVEPEAHDDGPPPAGPLANLGAGLVTLALGVGGVVVSLALGVGTPAQPGSGMWPLVVSVGLVVLSLAQLVVGRAGGDGERFTRHSWMPLVGLATLLGLVALLPVIGFEIPSLLLSLVWMRFLGGESWRTSVVCSLGAVVALYLVFVAALGTNVPHLF
ncbi:tripartite tricarboxylate transporter TctB family protein [Isoptericola sp. QY 916]|uniref:tripartite tricarboxylate transporter TctB family protein n=1 Tax=Isoptericola sp. QY 916 TaxID=2782570 RepID=UPI003D2FBDC9|nr:tripartite tricarboxylate transporter TctB family protein [Isoptericola sp. QY 916]